MPDNPCQSNQRDLPALAARVQQYVHAEGLWEPGQHLLLAVSGGPDSVALLALLQEYFSEDRLRFSVAHVHHGLRAEADEDAAFVEDLAERDALPFLQQWVDVPARVAATGESVEEAARALRYAALTEMAHGVQADRIVTAHHADDQAETVLMRVLRGTGVAGLAGIPPRRGIIVRPLLPIWRHEIEAYLCARGLTYRTDLSNYAVDFTRNRLRLELLPQLEREYAPRLRVRLQQLAELARQDNLALETLTDDAYVRLVERLPDGIAVLPEAALPRAVRWRVWRRAISDMCGSLQDIGFAHLAAIEALPPGGEVHLPGVRVLSEAGRLLLLPSGEAEKPADIPAQPLLVPGRRCLPEVGVCLTATASDDKPIIAGGDTAVIDAETVRGPLTVRSWQPGDRYRPFGAGGTRKLQDIFVDAGVPRRLRARIPVVSDSEGIVWLAGFRIADRVKIVPSTVRSICLQIEWELNPWTLQRSDLA